MPNASHLIGPRSVPHLSANKLPDHVRPHCVSGPAVGGKRTIAKTKHHSFILSPVPPTRHTVHTAQHVCQLSIWNYAPTSDPQQHPPGDAAGPGGGVAQRREKRRLRIVQKCASFGSVACHHGIGDPSSADAAASSDVCREQSQWAVEAIHLHPDGEHSQPRCK